MAYFATMLRPFLSGQRHRLFSHAAIWASASESGPLRVSTFKQHDLVDSQSHSDDRVRYAQRRALQTLPDYSVVSAQTERCDSQCRTRDRVRFNVFDASRCVETCLTAGSHVLMRLPRGVALCVDRKATLVPHPSSEDSARSSRHQHPR